jgi:hypothetical protein
MWMSNDDDSRREEGGRPEVESYALPPGAGPASRMPLRFLLTAGKWRWAVVLGFAAVLLISGGIAWHFLGAAGSFLSKNQMGERADGGANSANSAGTYGEKPRAGKLLHPAPLPQVGTIASPPETATIPENPAGPGASGVNAPATQAGLPQTALPTMSPPAAGPSVGTSAPAAAARTFAAVHEKNFGSECSGQLTLSAQGLRWECPSKAKDSRYIPVAEIDGPHKNGILLRSGDKYHFTVQDPQSRRTLSDREAADLFRNWWDSIPHEPAGQ